MRRVTKEELLSSDSPELILKTKDKKFTFKEKSYSITDDTIHGKGNFIYLEDQSWEPFEGQFSVKDVESIKLNKMGKISENPEVFITTKEREYILKSERSSYWIDNDTIYGKGQSRLIAGQFDGDIGINDAEEIRINKSNIGTTIVLASIPVLILVGIAIIALSIGGPISIMD